uniref:Uncharacterized protein n=1 Tax=viral metagenome TaxID=1070528 RepID=A0A6C0HQZ8_9ZZZZ
MLRLPPHDPADYEDFLREINRSGRIYNFPSIPEGMEGTITKISFICGCHGSLTASLRVKEENIPRNGIYEEMRQGPYEDYLTLLGDNTLTVYKNRAIYKTTKPIFEFDYLTICVRDMNVTLSTTNTCLGATVSRPSNGAILKQKFINDIMENMSSTCPTNTLTESIGKYGETFLESRSEYESKRQQSAARKITRLFTKKKRKSPTFGKSEKTRLMKHEREKVVWLMDKTYSVKTCDVAVLDTPVPPEGDVSTSATQCDAHKLVMIVTRYTATGCQSKKYILLSSSYEIEEEKENIYNDFSRNVRDFFDVITGNYEPDKIQGRTHDYPSHKISLFNLLRLAKMIITEINGRGAERTVPIEIHDLSCNSFGIFKKKVLNEQDKKLIRMLDDFARRKRISYGGKRKTKLK